MIIEEYFHDRLKNKLRYHQKKWYYYKSPHWKHIGYLKQLLIEEIESDPGITNNLKKMIYNVGYINKLILRLQPYFYTEEKFDENKTLMSCKNGVLDFSTCTFRDESATDNITIDNNILYREYTLQSPEVFVFTNIIAQIFPIVSERSKFYHYVIDALQGKSNIIYHYGEDNSGKSTILYFLLTLFGKYSIKLSEETKFLPKSTRLIVIEGSPKFTFNGTIMSWITYPSIRYPSIKYSHTFTQPDHTIGNKLLELKSAALWFLFNYHRTRFNLISNILVNPKSCMKIATPEQRMVITTLIYVNSLSDTVDILPTELIFQIIANILIG